MTEAEIAELKVAVERDHRCPATFRATERVREAIEGKPLQLEIALFDILGHPRALICYAWYAPGSDPKQPRPVTVLREGLVRSSLDALRFALDEEEGHR
ncbi:MAG TPA: hypothetical protein VIG95_11625 [Gemmatimonadales bacterium]